MPKVKTEKKVAKLRHEPLKNVMEQTPGKLKPMKTTKAVVDDDEDQENFDEEISSFNKSKSFNKVNSSNTADDFDDDNNMNNYDQSNDNDHDDDSNIDDDDANDEEYEDDEIVEFDGDNFAASGLSESEEAVVQKFLRATPNDARTLADIIMEKLRTNNEQVTDNTSQIHRENQPLPPKVIEVYTSVGKMLHHYKSGKLPKALKMLPHLKNWEEVLWITRPDEWSPCATYACTRIFASNLNVKMAQRFYNLVLLEKCRDDIRENKTLNYHLYMALKKSLFKPAAFYKGILLPLVQAGDCTLREATIFGSVIMKVSIPGNHSAAVLLRLSEMPYSGSNSLFIKILLNKKYALPRRVVDALVTHFVSFEQDKRVLPVVWHQSLLVFAQRYKLDLNDSQRRQFKHLLKIHAHHQITTEIRRELFTGHNNIIDNDDDEDDNDMKSVHTQKTYGTDNYHRMKDTQQQQQNMMT